MLKVVTPVTIAPACVPQKGKSRRSTAVSLIFFKTMAPKKKGKGGKGKKGAKKGARARQPALALSVSRSTRLRPRGASAAPRVRQSLARRRS